MLRFLVGLLAGTVLMTMCLASPVYTPGISAPASHPLLPRCSTENCEGYSNARVNIDRSGPDIVATLMISAISEKSIARAAQQSGRLKEHLLGPLLGGTLCKELWRPRSSVHRSTLPTAQRNEEPPNACAFASK